MELKRINLSSAIYFAIIAVVMYFIAGLLMVIAAAKDPSAIEQLSAQFGYISPIHSLITAPLVMGIVFYIILLVVIIVYNIVARRFPISWQIR